VNDQAGHLAGDQLLISISEKIRSRLRKKDLGARLSGDEFAILLHDVKSKDLENLANNYREMLQNTHFNYEGRDYSVSGSIGAALITDQATSKKELLNAADYACQQAKQQGKNQVFICPNPNDAKMSHQQSGWHNKIQTALEDQSFKLMFQPIYAMSKLDTLHLRDLNDTKKTEWLTSYCRPSQFECFVRLKNTDGKIIMPGAFISDAERFDLMASIDLWVLERTFSTLKRLSFKPTINVNVSASTLLDSNASQKLLTLIHENSGLCNYLQLEIKEHHLLHYREMLIPVLETLADLGCRLQVDDFGRNFSLFSKLRELPISGIKIDGLFTQNIAWDPVDRKLMHSMAEVARSSDIVVTVKAIETYEALESLEQGGIDFVQGHWLSYPHETLLLNQY